MGLVVWSASTLQLPGQSTEELHRQFVAVKARAEKGDAEAQLSLALLYSDGTGVARDATKAAKWLHKAAEQELPRAQWLLALDYASGHGVKVDEAQALHWLTKAAKHDLPRAQLQLGMWYLKGENTQENPVEAASWFRRAAEQGLASAQFQLGQCYLEGAGVPKDIPQSLEWTRKAAEQGFASAQNALGLAYLNGKGVTKDYLEAYKWFDLAGAQSDPDVYDFKVNLAKTESFMTADQIAQAQKLALEFKPAKPLPTPNSSKVATADRAAAPNAETPAVSNIGWLNVMASDASAEIFVDGSFVGNAPAKLKLDPGSHLVEVKKSGFKDYRRQISITAGSELSLNASLQAN